jgi:ribosomal protein L11 methyltransferase
VDAVCGRLWGAGVLGIQEIGVADGVRLVVGVDGDDAAVRAAFGVPVEPVEPFALATTTTELVVAGRRLVIAAPPGVFGDARHATTRTCLRLLPHLAGPGTRVLDVGCGTGVLAVAAAVLGARVTAVDIQPESVAATRQNATDNGVDLDVHLGTATPGHDLVLANLSAATIRTLDLAWAPTLLLSGILRPQWPQIRAELPGHDVKQLHTIDGWTTAVLEQHAPTKPPHSSPT